MAKIWVDAERCKTCGQCVDICPEGLIVQKSPRALPRILRQRDCVACGHCVSICPTGAMQHADFPPEEMQGVL